MVAKPSIADVFEEFLAKRDRPTKARPYTVKRSIVGLLEDCMNGYAYESLTSDEAEMWQRRWEQDEIANSFCRTFGPKRIPEQIGPFLGWFIIRKVLGGSEIAGAGGPVTLELLEWLEEKRYIKGRAVAEAKEHARAAAESLARAEKLSAVLYELTETRVPGRVVEDLDIEDELVTIAKVEPSRLWFTDPDGEEIGPLAVPAGTGELAKVGWEVSATHFVRTAKAWHLVEVGNVYPR